jgi:hypothetical protein
VHGWRAVAPPSPSVERCCRFRRRRRQTCRAARRRAARQESASTTRSASPTESANRASSSGSVPSAAAAIGSDISVCSESSRREVRARARSLTPVRFPHHRCEPPGLAVKEQLHAVGAAGKRLAILLAGAIRSS